MLLSIALVACAGLTGLGDYPIDDGIPDAATEARADGMVSTPGDGATVADSMVSRDGATNDVTSPPPPPPPPNDCSNKPCDVIVGTDIADVAVDDSNLYLLDDKAKSVRVANLDGSNLRDFVTDENESYPLRGLEVTAGYVVWLSKAFRRVKTSGGAVSDNTFGPVLDNVKCVRKGTGNDVFFLRNQDIFKVDVTSGSGGPLAPFPTTAGVGIAGSGTYGSSSGSAADFFITGNSRVYEVKQLGGSGTEIIGNLMTPQCIALAPNGVLWWADNAAGRLYHSASDRKSWSAFEGETGIHGVSLNATHVYWSHANGIRRRKL